MLNYGPPSGATILSRTPGTVAAQRARRCIAAAKNASGWVRKAYLQSAIEHLSDLERAVLRESSFAALGVGRGASQLVKALIEATVEFQKVASVDEQETAIAQVIRSYGVELDAALA